MMLDQEMLVNETKSIQEEIEWRRMLPRMSKDALEAHSPNKGLDEPPRMSNGALPHR